MWTLAQAYILLISVAAHLPLATTAFVLQYPGMASRTCRMAVCTRLSSVADSLPHPVFLPSQTIDPFLPGGSGGCGGIAISAATRYMPSNCNINSPRIILPWLQ